MAPSQRLDQDALLATLERQIAVITRRQAFAVGLTRHALRHRLRAGGPWRSLLPGVYVAATGTPTTLQQEMAALLYAGPGTVITGLAAIRHHDIRGPVTEFVDVLVPASRRRRDAAFVRLHRTTRMPGRSQQVGPVRYALLARAVADTARSLDDLRDVRAVVADAVQRGRCPVRDLAAELKAGPDIRSALFREALADVADGIRSAAEGDLKDLLARSGLPMPLFNAKVFAGQEFIAMPDGWWPKFGLAIEVDSTEWHLSPEDHANTLARGRRMAVHQINVLRVTPSQLRTEPAQLVAEIRAALEGARGRPPLNLRTVQAAKPLSRPAPPAAAPPAWAARRSASAVFLSSR
jgi:hypothetical protein